MELFLTLSTKNHLLSHLVSCLPDWGGDLYSPYLALENLAYASSYFNVAEPLEARLQGNGRMIGLCLCKAVLSHSHAFLNEQLPGMKPYISATLCVLLNLSCLYHVYTSEL